MELLRVFFLLTAITLNIRNTTALYGYDCAQELTNVTTISLVDVGDCDLNKPKINTTKIYAQFLQLNDFTETKVYTCSVKLTRIITDCGLGSYAARVKNGEITYYKDLSREECLKIHSTGFYSFAGISMDDIQRNGTTTRRVELAGSTEYGGKCKGGSYSDKWGKWDDVVVAGFVEIKLKDYNTQVNIDKNKIKINSGIFCTFTDTQCLDADANHAFWDLLPESNCGNNKYSVLFEGNINKIHDLDNNRIMYSVETNEITFSLYKRGELTVCGSVVSGTEHPKLFMLENAIENRFLIKKPLSPANVDIFAYINSKFVYVERYIQKQITQMYYSILETRCLLERKVLTNALAIATMMPQEFGSQILNTEGVIGILTGEVLHLSRCVRVAVQERKTKNCYDQLPVFRGKEEFFLMPRSRILVKTGTPIHCDLRLPAMYKIGDYWIKLNPAGSKADPPEILSPQTKLHWQYNSAATLALGGIYSDSDTGRLRDMLLFPVEKGAVLNKVAMGMSGRHIDNNGISITPFLDATALETLAENTVARFWQKFINLGSIFSGIIGVFLIFRFIKLIADTIIHGYAIYSLYGFSVHLLGSIFNSVTQLLLHLGHSFDKENKAQETKIDEEKNTEGENKNRVPTKAEIDVHEELEKQILYPQLYHNINNHDSI